MGSNKGILLGAVFIGSAVGSWVPTLFGVSFLSPWSIVSSAVFATLALYLAYNYL